MAESRVQILCKGGEGNGAMDKQRGCRADDVYNNFSEFGLNIFGRIYFFRISQFRSDFFTV